MQKWPNFPLRQVSINLSFRVVLSLRGQERKQNFTNIRSCINKTNKANQISAEEI